MWRVGAAPKTVPLPTPPRLVRTPPHPRLLLLLLLLLLCCSTELTTAAAGVLPHVDECNLCQSCQVDGTLELWRPGKNGLAALERFGPLLQPPNVTAKAALPNCTECRGCNVELRDIGSMPVDFVNGVSFKHGVGATNTRLFFTQLPGHERRHIIKVWCVAVSKVRDVTSPVACSVRQASERVELLLAQQQLLEDCGATALSPGVWLTKVSAILPGGSGLHIHWHGLAMEEARGITLHALNWGRHWRLAIDLLQERLNRTAVAAAALWDVLTAQCDRHAENVFIDDAGDIQVIDNDKALGVIAKCGYDSMFVPGTRYHSIMRVGFWGQHADKYRSYRKVAEFCHGPIDPRVVMDYRCAVDGSASDGGVMGTAYPPSMERCMRRIAGMSGPEEVMDAYGLSNPLRASILHNRSKDLIERGFEWTLEHGLPTNGPRVATYPQTACCNLMVWKRMITCDKCWSPLLPEDIPSNSTLNIAPKP